MMANYQYDLNEDFIDPFQSKPLWMWIWIGTNFLAGSVFLLRYFDGEPKMHLLISGIAFLASALLLLINRKRGGRPLTKKGVVYLKVEDGKLSMKWNRFSAEKSLDLNQVKSAMVGVREVILKLKDGEEFFIQTSKIVNPEKKEEFENYIRQHFSK